MKGKKKMSIEYLITSWVRRDSCWFEYSSEFIYVDIIGETLLVDMISVCAALWLTCVAI
jgi:hypothetical protein